MSIQATLPRIVLERLPVSFQYFAPVLRKNAVFVNKYIYIKRYNSQFCSVYPPLKPLSKIT